MSARRRPPAVPAWLLVWLFAAALTAATAAGCRRPRPPVVRHDGAPPNGAPPRTATAPAVAGTVEDSVAGALLDALAARDRTGQAVVADSTWADLAHPAAVAPVAAAADSLAPAGAAAGLGADLARRNRAPRALTPAGARTPVTRLGRAAYAPADPRRAAAFWAAFPARYAGAAGVLVLSRPGLGADGHAAVAVRRLVGAGGSSGELFLLRREGARWRVVAERVLWVS